MSDIFQYVCYGLSIYLCACVAFLEITVCVCLFILFLTLLFHLKESNSSAVA